MPEPWHSKERRGADLKSCRVSIQLFLTSDHDAVSPCARVNELLETPICSVILESLDGALQTQSQIDKWKHDLRQAWRSHLLRQTAKDRSRQDMRAEFLDSTRSMKYFKFLESQVENEDSDIAEQRRMKLSVLRRTFAGRPLTEGRVSQHRRRAPSICPCGFQEEDTVEHVSWRCVKYATLRAPLLATLPRPRECLPVIAQYAALILKDSPMTFEQIHCLQETLGIIWQRHIPSFYAEDINDTPPPVPDPTTSSSQSAANARQSNGHALAMLPSRGMLCRKCGKQVTRLHHIRFRISTHSTIRMQD